MSNFSDSQLNGAKKSSPATEMRQIRLLATNGTKVYREFDASLTVKDIKLQLVQQWPSELPVVSNASNIKLIYSGSFLDDATQLKDLVCTSDILSVHLIVKKSRHHNARAQSSAPAPPTSESPSDGAPLPSDPAPPPAERSRFIRENPETGEIEMDDSNAMHLHGCTVSQEEVDQMQQVFVRKAGGADARMHFSQVHSFLRTYWRFVKSRGMIDANREFPTQRVLDMKARVLRHNASGDETVDLDQFLELYFLFDNDTPDETCPHGERQRVHQATEKLHAELHPDGAFEEEVFARVFARIDSDNDQCLTCKEVDMLYYMYAATLMRMYPAAPLDDNDDDNQEEAAPHSPTVSAH